MNIPMTDEQMLLAYQEHEQAKHPQPRIHQIPELLRSVFMSLFWLMIIAMGLSGLGLLLGLAARVWYWALFGFGINS